MKKTNKGFSLVELIIVIAIMAILAAALAPSLIKYINKSRLSTDLTTGVAIAEAAQTAMAKENANDSLNTVIPVTVVTKVQDVLDASANNEFSKEFAEILAVKEVKGKSRKDLAKGTLDKTFYISVDDKDKFSVWYGATDAAHQCSPEKGASLSDN